MEIIFILIFYWSYLSFWLLSYLSYKIYKKWFKKNKKNIIYLLVTLVFIYSRFIEPNIITIQKTQIDVWFKANILILSDLHLWIYNSEDFLERIVKKVNKIKNIDFVIIPWDSIFYPNSKEELDSLFLPLSKIKQPIYLTFWSHDFETETINKDDLIKTFTKYNINILDNKGIKIKNINILWLWDNEISDDKIELIKGYSKNQNLLVIAHNPDTTLAYKNNDIPDVTISGHTHGWQIRIPFIYKYVIPCNWDFDEGFYNYNNNKLFVTSWLGEVLLPMRLFIPPVIDILELR